MATPSQVTSSKAMQNRCRLFRLQMLIIDGGLLILRNIFDQKLQNVPLVAFLKNERHTITNLRSRGIITQVQYDLLFPSGGTGPTSTDLDITLIICLLRNTKSLGLNKNFQWNSIPAQGDTSVEADISRLKMYRNELSHISSTSGITLPIFTTKWTEIEQVLLRLNSAVSPIPHLQKMIDDFKVNPLDPEAERRIQKAIDSWKMLERGVEANLKLMKMEDEKIKYTLNVQGQTVRKHAQSIDELNKQTSEHDKHIHDQTKQIQELKEETRKDVTADTESMRQSQYEESKKSWYHEVWKSDVKAIEQLLKGSDIPSQPSINFAYRRFGRKHKVVKDMCTKVCTYIQKTQPDVIKSVWPSYRYVKDAPVEQLSENDVIFVVVTQSGKKGDIDNSNYKQYMTYIRESSEISQESREVNKLEAENTPYEDKGIRRKQKRIVKCMNENVDNLLEKHSNITTISASLFKSRNFELGKHHLEDNLCIVLYVHVKGYIPLHEEPFDQNVDEYDVDVRECVFTPVMNGPKDFHSTLKMGLEIGITSNPDAPGENGKFGTIGHFEPKYFVTCAHVVMDIDEMKKLSKKQTDIKIYQPLVQESRKLCGRVIRAVYREKTGSNNVGVDAALVEIVDREFTPNEFPHSDILGELGLTADLTSILQTGVYIPNHAKNMDVIKYGCASNVTKGGYTLVSHPVVTVYDRIQLRNQITIWPRGKFSHFAAGGDSGAVVFEHIDGKLYSTCMIEGTMSDGRAVATPLIDVLVALDIKSPEDVIKLYEDEDGESDMDDSP